MASPRHLLGVRLGIPLLAQLDAHCTQTRHTRRQVIELALEAYLGVTPAPGAVEPDPRQTELFAAQKESHA